MRVWLVCDHEPLATDTGNRQPMRAGMLAQALTAAGHETVWYTSDFDHYLKRRRKPSPSGLELGSVLTTRILAAPSYRHNVSVARLIHNIVFARKFYQVTRQLPPPDIVVCAIPTTNSAAVAVQVALAHNVPAIVDVQDIWPDSFRAFIPKAVGFLGTPFIDLLDRQVRFACSNAAGLIGTSNAYLDWALAKAGSPEAAIPRLMVPLGYARPPLPSSTDCLEFRRGLNISADQRVVSFVGSWGLSHDFDLLYATARILAARQDVVLVVAGDANNLHRQASAFAHLSNVRLPGWLDSRQSARLLFTSDIGLLPYRKHAPQVLPNKVFEYMAYGAFQISTLQGEIGQLYKRTDTGSVSESTPESLATAILDRLTVSDTKAARSGRMDVFLSEFSSDKVYARMTSFIESVAHANAGA